MNYDTLNTQEKFASKWLFEMSQRTGPSGTNPYDSLMNLIDSNKQAGHAPETHTSGLKSMDPGDQQIYWEELNGKPQIIIALEPFHNNYAISDVGKLPGSENRAYKFYEKLLQSCGGNLIFSGQLISDEAIELWKNLLSKTNAKLFGYDYTNTRDYTRIASEKDLETYLGDTPDFQKRRFVLAENIKRLTGEVWTSFEMMKIYKNTFGILD